MLNIKIICVGKIKEKASSSLIQEYLKRLSKYSKVEIIEINDEKLPTNLNDGEINRIKELESNRIIDKLNQIQNKEVFLLDLNGDEYSSEEFANKLNNVASYSSSQIVFVIGGSLGMSDKLLKLSKNKICFSKMTFPHQLIRLFLLEQLFRAFKIQNNERYHH